MKLILTHTVDGLGSVGDVVEVKDGYGRNYLVPQRLAVAWTPGAEKQVNGVRRTQAARAIRDLDHAQEVKAQLEALTVTLSVRAGTSGKLFGSVTPADVAGAIRGSGGPLLEKRSIALSTPIRSIGGHDVEITLHPEVLARVALNVVAG